MAQFDSTAAARLARTCAPLATAVARRRPYALLPTSEALAALRAFPVVDGAKAARHLGHVARPIEETLRDLYARTFQSPPTERQQIGNRSCPPSLRANSPWMVNLG